MTKLSDDLAYRGLIKDKTFSNLSWLDEPKKFYLGIDASSDSLTIGNLAVFMLARRFIDAGWKAVLLAGGATSLVGDPGGKEEERELKPVDVIAKNIEGVKSQIENLFNNQPHELVNNLDWLGEVKLLDFLRDIGKNFSMTDLLQRDFVTTRIGEGTAGISYAEFSYSLLQGYDFWHLHKTKGVDLQLGASDQWGNMLSGVNLVRRKSLEEVHALSMPLIINKQTGKKFGKSEAGAVWLDAKKTSPRDFYQFWINLPDESVEDFLKVYTLLTKDEITDVIAQHSASPSARIGQKRLAHEVTTIVHGRQLADAAGQQADAISSGDVAGAAIKLKSGISLVDALVESKLVTSKSEARRLIEEGAIYANNQPIHVDVLNAQDFDGGRLLLRKGKKYQNSVILELK